MTRPRVALVQQLEAAPGAPFVTNAITAGWAGAVVAAAGSTAAVRPWAQSAPGCTP